MYDYIYYFVGFYATLAFPTMYSGFYILLVNKYHSYFHYKQYVVYMCEIYIEISKTLIGQVS